MNSPVDPNWYVDSGATHHLTADIANLAAHSEYQGPDRVRMGNGTGLPIRATGASLLCSPISSFVLKNLLHVPNITKNLLSVSQFTADNKILLEFHPVYCRDNLRMACMSSPCGIITSPLSPGSSWYIFLRLA